LNKYKGAIAQLLPVYNTYFKYAPEMFDSEEILTQAIEIGKIATTSKQKNMEEMHKCEGVLLFHIMIQIIPNKLKENQWMAIFDHCSNLIDQEKKDF